MIHFDKYWFDPASFVARMDSVLSSERFHQPEIVDVEYIDVTYHCIIDPARLIAEHSAVPFYVEDRRRETVMNRVIGLGEDIDDLLQEFGDLFFCCSKDKPLYQWEHDLDRAIGHAFISLERTLRDALLEFVRIAYGPAELMWELHSLSDEDYTTARAEFERQNNLQDIRHSFERDLSELIYKTKIADDGLPF